MLTLLAALSALSVQASDEYREAGRVREDRPPVRLWMNSDRQYREGDRVRLQVDADVNGFLLVLNYDPTGRLRVLFPYDPRDDSRVSAGRRYEVRAENYDGAFRAPGDGTGLIYAAISSEPWRFDEIVLADRWDITRLELDIRSDDPEPEITELVQRLSGPGGFDYDVLGYRVYGESTSATYNTYVYPRGPIYVHDDYWFCNNWSWRYDGCHRWPYDGGWSFGLGFYNPYYYGYYPYRYRSGYGYPYYYPYRPSYPIGRAPVIAGRPRGYTVVPRGSLGTRFGSGTAVTGPGRGPSRSTGVLPGGDRGRAPARPAREGIGRSGPNVSAPGSAAPARRARGEGSSARPPVGRSTPSRAEPSRGDRGPARAAPSSGREAPPRAREAPSRPRGGETSRYEAPPARSEPSRREAPPARSQPAYREAPRARSEPSRREAPPVRSEPSRREAPPVRSEPSRREAPAPQAQPSRGGSGGGHSSPPSRSRRPRGQL